MSVDVVLNGQTLSVEPSDVSLTVADAVCSVVVCGNAVQFPAGLVFILKQRMDEDGSEFVLATHCLNALLLRYRDGPLHDMVSDFASAIQTAGVPRIDAPRGRDILRLDYGRMGMDGESSRWRVTQVNADFSVCPTYPRIFAVPRSISDSVVRHAARFRARSRLPMLSYAHPDNAAIFRSSQALVGLQRSRSVQDERLVDAVRLASPSGRLLIVDARPSRSAMANAVAGAGFMPLEHYADCERVYLGIENIHAVRASYLKIFQYMLEGLPLRSAKQEAGWTRHYAAVMEGVRIIVEHINAGTAVLVHCSDGWDRTAQLVSLAQLCLDPYTRTVDGFLAMLQREWIAAGHRFESRLARSLCVNTLRLPGRGAAGKGLAHVLEGLSRSSEDGGKHRPEDEFCPVFPQFLDCVLQFLRVYPAAFEFDARLVHALWQEAYLTQTDTFKYDCEQQRFKENASSFAEHIQCTIEAFRNQRYSPIGQLPISSDVLFYL